MFAKKLDRHIFGFLMKNLAISDQYFQRFHCLKKYMGNCAVFSSTAHLQIPFVEIILRHPVVIPLIENKIPKRGIIFIGSPGISLKHQQYQHISIIQYTHQQFPTNTSTISHIHINSISHTHQQYHTYDQ